MSGRERSQGGPRSIRPFDVNPSCSVIVTLQAGTLALQPYGVKGAEVIYFQVTRATKRLRDFTGTFCTNVTKGVDLRVTPAGGGSTSTVVGKVDHIAVEKPAKASAKAAS